MLTLFARLRTSAALLKIAPIFLDSRGMRRDGPPLLVKSQLVLLDDTGPVRADFLGKNYHQPMAVALYGLDLALCGTAFTLLRTELIR